MRWRSLLSIVGLASLCGARLAAASEPIVRVLAPGFAVRELPVRLSNVNNLVFAPDGRLTALGYDGRIHLLGDTNDDGLEDQAVVFWDRPTLSVPVGMVWAPAGLYVSSQGKVSLLRDTDGDGRADREEIVASGWPPTEVGSGGVDATAVTRDLEGNLYFGLIVADYSNPYRVKDGVSRYDLHGPRGTIQKWDVRTRKLETIATGVRVPYALAFNRHGDLFMTDQEGQTWCPNGNPLDELDHIVPSRNYGFPPRHEQWLPNLVSESPVVAFGPQHQSTCGLVFNEPVRPVAAASATPPPQDGSLGARPSARPRASKPPSSTAPGRFGPKWWEGDAFVAGESRGKIWRVHLVKTPFGYVGKEFLFARLSMLTTDVTLSPRGELYVSCHSGQPDWGTGPQGEGKLFKIAYTEPQAPQPVLAWATSSLEVRVAFDRPVDSSVTNALGREIEFGEFVRAADRYEVLKPPYQVVKDQAAAPRGKLKIVGAALTDAQQTLVLQTDPHPHSATFAMTLPGVKARGAIGSGAEVDFEYDLHGVQAALYPGASDSDPKWAGWLPYLDTEVARSFTAASPAHQNLWRRLSLQGRLRLDTHLKLPPGERTLFFEANVPFQVLYGHDYPFRADEPANGKVTLVVRSQGEPQPLRLTLELPGRKAPWLRATYSATGDPAIRPLPREALSPSWCPPAPAPFTPETNRTELAGGDWQRGKDLFFSQRLMCGSCHRVRGEGGLVGADLSNLAHRDAASVRRDIQEPNALINPDYVSYNLTLRDGGQITGLVRRAGDETLRITGADGKQVTLKIAEVEELAPSTVSLMPSGFLEGLEEVQIRDLLTYLMNEPPPGERRLLPARADSPK